MKPIRVDNETTANQYVVCLFYEIYCISLLVFTPRKQSGDALETEFFPF